MSAACISAFEIEENASAQGSSSDQILGRYQEKLKKTYVKLIVTYFLA